MSINCQSGFWKKEYTTANKIALEKGTYVAFNSIGTGHFLCHGPAFLLKAVAKHVDDKVDNGFYLNTLDITIAMEAAIGQLDNQEEAEVEKEDINTTFLQINNAPIEINTSQEIFGNNNPSVEPHLETPTASTSKTCPTWRIFSALALHESPNFLHCLSNDGFLLNVSRQTETFKNEKKHGCMFAVSFCFLSDII